MNAHEIAYAIQQDNGWSDATLLDYVLEYVDRQGDTPALEDSLLERAE